MASPILRKVAGAIEYTRRGEEPTTLAVLNQFARKESDAWEYTLDALRDFFDETLASGEAPHPPATTASSIFSLSQTEPPATVIAMLGAYGESARLLGLRTAELHACLASGQEAAAFAPEPFTPYYQRGLYQSMRNLTTNSFALLRTYLRHAQEPPAEAAIALALEEEVLSRFRRLVGRSLVSRRIRIHGDYHLGQLLYTGNDFLVIDFEGEPSRSLNERRIRRTPLRDVAGMLRSFDYAMHSALQEQRRSGLNEEAYESAKSWGRYWQAWVSAIFVRSYLDAAAQAGFLTAPRDEIELLLDVHILEKAVYEMAYELNNRPEWLHRAATGHARVAKGEVLNPGSRAGLADIRRLAALYGIQTSYLDMDKTRLWASANAMLAALKALGAPIEGSADLEAARRQRHQELWAWHLEPVAVSWDQKPFSVALRLPEATSGLVQAELRLENGEDFSSSFDLASLPVTATQTLGSERFVERRISLASAGLGTAATLPFGYHKLSLTLAGRHLESQHHRGADPLL